MSQDQTNIDPIFKVPSCSGRSGGGIASGADSQEWQRADETHSRGKALRDALFGSKKGTKRDRSTPPRLLQKEISRRGLDFATYITSIGRVDPYTEPLRRVLPLISHRCLTDEEAEKGELSVALGDICLVEQMNRKAHGKDC